MWSQSFAAHWLRDGWPTRFCSSDRRESANGHLPLDWRSRCFAKRAMNGCSILAANCPGCVQVIAGTHPDFLFIARPPGKEFYSAGTLQRGRTGLSSAAVAIVQFGAAFVRRQTEDRSDRRCRLPEPGRRELSVENTGRAAGAQRVDLDRHQRRSPTSHNSLACPVGPISSTGEIAGGKAAGAK